VAAEQGRRNRLASPRFRRRLRWIALALGLAAAVAALAIAFPNTGKRHEVFDSAPIQVSKEPTHVAAGPRRRAEALIATMAFVRTAVLRRNVDASWDLATADLRAGYTRKQWDTGDIPVVPFPAAGIGAWQVDWSYENDMGFDILLLPRKGSNLGAKSFMVELKRSSPHGKWRVASWVPHGVSVEQDIGNASKGQRQPAVASSLGGKWLLLPVIALALVFLVPLAVFAGRGLVRRHRAERAYRASLRS
jgi:hypothetical protein